MFLFKIFLSILALAPLASAQFCYFPDGTVDRNTTVANQANVGDGAGSVCCQQGDNYNGTYCLVVSEEVNFGPPKELYRPSCTDQDWASEACPADCRSVNRGARTFVMPCGRNKDGSACCWDGRSLPTCDCAPHFGPDSDFWPEDPGSVNPSSTPSGPSSVSPNQQTPSSNSPAEASDPNSISTRTIGLAIGLSLGPVLLIASIVFFIYSRRVKKKRLLRSDPPLSELNSVEKKMSVVEINTKHGPAGEVEPRYVPSEMEVTLPRYEMDAGYGYEKEARRVQ